MKKLISILLIFGMLLSLASAALASGEATVEEQESITEPGLEEDPAVDLPAEALETVEEPETPAPDTEPAPVAEEPGTDEVSMEPAAEEPVPEEPGPEEIEYIPDGKTGNGKALQLTAGDIAGAQQSNVYFGKYKQSGSEKEPIKWRVLENSGSRLFLLSDQNLDVYRYHNTYTAITWADSDIRAWLNDTSAGFAGDALSAVELAAIPQTDVVNDDNPEYGTEGGENTRDQVFLLSIAEVTNTAYGFTDNYSSTSTRESTNTANVDFGGKTGTGGMYAAGDTDVWWLRSPGGAQEYAAFVNDIGYVRSSGYYVTYESVAVRPAFKIDLSSVLFTSAAEGGKDGSLGALTEIGSYTGNDWKLTLTDESRQFKVSETSAAASPGDTVELNYTGATVYKEGSAPKEYISAIITDDSGEPLCYGRLTQPAAASGTVSVPIPAELGEGTYTLKLFSEQYNGDKKTDYASAFSDVTLTVTSGLILGGVTIDDAVVYYGDTVSCSLSGDAASIPASRLHYQWQTSPDKTSWTGVSGATGAIWHTPSGGTSVSYARVIVTADGYTGELVSDAHALNVNSSTASVIEGSVMIRQTTEDETSFLPGKEIKGTYRNKGGVISTAPSLRYQWQRSANNANWEDIPGADSSVYTPTDGDAGYWLRLVVTSVYSTGEVISTSKPVKASDPTVKLSADATTAQATNFTGLYARVALVIDNNGVSGLYVTQATINPGGEIVIPSFIIPGLTVKGVSVALVPTSEDIQKSMPDVKASDMKMLG